MIFRTESEISIVECDCVTQELNKIFLSDFVFCADSDIMTWSDEQ